MKCKKKYSKKTIGVCRFVYNFYLAHNRDRYNNGETFMSGMDFSKWLNNIFIPNHTDFSWIKEVYSKAVKKSIMNADRAFNRFFKGKNKFPRFKKKNKNDVSMYFVRNNSKSIIHCQRHRIKIPTLGWVKLKEKGYLPTKSTIKSGVITQKAGRYYVSVVIEEPSHESLRSYSEGIGIDLGINNFAVISNIENPIINVNKTSRVKKLEKSLKRQQRKLSRKFESFKKSNYKKEETATRRNIHKQILKVQRLYQHISNIRVNHISQTVNMIIKQKPSFISIEDLNIRGMMKNRHLARAISAQCFYSFKMKLEYKCKHNGIELRIVDRFYPSSKLCSSCNYKKVDLKLSDRIYSCNNCNKKIDRDMNAAFNLKNANVYKIV